jgi:hypothetical protein
MDRTMLVIRRRLAPAAFALALAASTAHAQDQTAGTPGEWLTRFTGARTLGLGGAYVALADDPLGVLWNPAGLSTMDQNELRFENAQLFETSINAFGFAVPGSWLPSFGVSVVSMGSGDFQRTNDMNDPLGTFKNGETAYLMSASKALSPRLSIGTNFKFVQQTVEDFSAQGFGADLGALFAVTPTVRLGASVANLSGPSLKLRDVAETYPMQIRGGVAAQVLGGRGLVAAELDQSSGLGARIHAGLEYWLQPMLGLRAGFDDSYGTGGLSYRFSPQYQLDYAVADPASGLTHRVGISYRFGGFFASSKAEPAIFSPTGDKAVTKISLNAHTKADPDQWTLEIVNKSDEVVRRFAGPGQPPSHVQWDGKGETGLPLPDGTYHYRLTVKDRAGRSLLATTHAIEISTTGPRGDVPVIPVQGATQETPDPGNPK